MFILLLFGLVFLVKHGKRRASPWGIAGMMKSAVTSITAINQPIKKYYKVILMNQ